MLDHVDDIIERGRKPKDVLAVKRRDVLGIEKMKKITGQPVSDVLDLLDLGVAHCGAGKATETRLCLASGFERVGAGLREQVVELGRPWDQREFQRRLLDKRPRE